VDRNPEKVQKNGDAGTKIHCQVPLIHVLKTFSNDVFPLSFSFTMV
jgi:hypothetical protein